MFSTVRSFLFGDAAQQLAVEENQHANFSTKDTELGWVLVDQPDAGGVVEPVVNPENPLENLLIEHPTMSVYCTQPGSGPDRDQDSGISGVNRPALGHQPMAVAPFYQQPGVPTSHLSTENLGLVCHQQTQHLKHITKHLNRKHLQRSNKCSFFNSCKKQGSKHNRLLHPCGSKSGRRSQRAQ